MAVVSCDLGGVVFANIFILPDTYLYVIMQALFLFFFPVAVVRSSTNANLSVIILVRTPSTQKLKIFFIY